jgi:drug/metabolite transporter (DMT)-like permease
MSDTVRGVPPLLAYAVLSGAVDVYAGDRVQALSPIVVAAISFTIVVVGFGAPTAGAVLRLARACTRDAVVLNVMTAITWVTLLYSLKFLEPAVANEVAFAIGPALTALAGPWLRRGSRTLRTELVVAVVIFGLIGLLMWESTAGLSGLRDVPPDRVLLGFALAFVCGLGCVGSVVYSKRLSDAGASPSATVAVRYALLVVVCWALVGGTGAGGSIGPALLPSALIAVLGVALPNYLGQIGLKHVEPITCALLDTLSPVFAFLLQLPDSRLHPSLLTLTGIVGVTVMVGVGLLARWRHERRPVPAELAAVS